MSVTDGPWRFYVVGPRTIRLTNEAAPERPFYANGPMRVQQAARTPSFPTIEDAAAHFTGRAGYYTLAGIDGAAEREPELKEAWKTAYETAEVLNQLTGGLAEEETA